MVQSCVSQRDGVGSERDELGRMFLVKSTPQPVLCFIDCTGLGATSWCCEFDITPELSSSNSCLRSRENLRPLADICSHGIGRDLEFPILFDRLNSPFELFAEGL